MHLPEEFGALQLQGALFFKPSEEGLKARDAWNILSSDPAEQISENSATPSQVASYGGRWDEYNLSVKSQTGRLDVFLQPAPVDLDINTPLLPPRIFDIPKAIKALQGLLQNIALNRSILRIGMIVELMKPINKETENSCLENDLKPYTLPPNSRDASVRFNVRRPFEFDNSLEMNRLVSLETGKTGRVQIQFPPQISQATPIFVNPFIKFRIDVNSIPETALPDGMEIAVIDEISDEVIKIKKEGFSRFK